jgi:hypothetical protein
MPRKEASYSFNSHLRPCLLRRNSYLRRPPEAHGERSMSRYLASDSDQSTRALKDELRDDELNGVSGGGQVCKYAGLVGTIVAEAPPKHWFNGG